MVAPASGCNFNSLAADSLAADSLGADSLAAGDKRLAAHVLLTHY